MIQAEKYKSNFLSARSAALSAGGQTFWVILCEKGSRLLPWIYEK